MIFAPIRPVILALVKRLMGTGVSCVWRDQKSTYTPPGTKTVCKLSLGPSGSKGWGESRIDYDPQAPAGQELTETVVQTRQFTLKILCECLDQTDEATAWNYLETLRTRFMWDSSLSALRSVNVALFGDSDLQDLSRVVDGRSLSAANLDIRLRTVAQEKDTQNPFTYIEKVNATGDLSGSVETVNIDGTLGS